MNRKKYPCGEEIRHFLADFCFEVNPQIGFDHFAEEAAQEWELKTGWLPFLATPKPLTRNFKVERQPGYPRNFPIRVIDFKGGLIRIDKVTDERGKILEVEKDYRFCCHSSLALESQTYIELMGNGLANSQVSITGIWGAVEKVPSVVWSAILKKAGAEILACFSCTKDARLEKWSEGGIVEQYKTQPFKDVIQRWETHFNSVVNQYKRVPILL